MRLADAIRSLPINRGYDIADDLPDNTLKQLIGRGETIICDDVMMVYAALAEDKKHEALIRMFKNVAPPFSSFLMEMTYPGWVDETRGWHFSTQIVPGDGWICLGRYFMYESVENRVWVFPVHIRIRVSEDGHLKEEPQIRVAPSVRHQKVAIAELMEQAGFVIGAALFGLTLMHCKNVEVSDYAESTLGKPWKRRNPDWKFTFKRLRVHAVNKSGKSTSSIGNLMSMHVCRGHFRDHTKHGLFGNPNMKGIYWVPDHIRGDIEVGIVKKDYEV